VLGFIGLVAFGLGKSGLLEKVGKAVHQEELPELFETLHMALFATMVVFIVEVFIMLKAAGSRLSRPGPPFDPSPTRMHAQQP